MKKAEALKEAWHIIEWMNYILPKDFQERLAPKIAEDLIKLVNENNDEIVKFVREQCQSYRWRNKEYHNYIDVQPCGYCGACKASVALEKKLNDEKEEEKEA